MQRDSLAQRAWYRGVPTHRVNGTKDSTCGTSRVLGCRETHWHRELGTRGTKGTEVPTHRVNGTKNSTCGNSRVLGCRETHWHRERGTKGTEGYQHIESVVPKTQHVVPAEYWGAERLTGTESVVPGVPRGTNR